MELVALVLFLSIIWQPCCNAFVVDDDKLPTREFELLMPKADPKEPETYLCTPLKLDKQNTYYIVGFEPRAEKKTAHHMLLYGCKTPGRQDPVFNCGAMTVKQEGLNSAMNPCGSGSSIIYAWAQNAPKLQLPKDVAFRVGGPDSGIDYLVLQVHYATVDDIPADGDTSGVNIHYTYLPQPKSAGVYWTSTYGRFPSGQTTHAEASCALRTNFVLHPFAFRVHTHALGTAVSGWKVSPKMEWTLLGIDDPQLPQMFNPVADKSVTLTGGDVIASRCTMYNFKDHAVYVGTTREDEMCNFYLMYWVDGPRIPAESLCNTMGPPLYSWGGWILGGHLTNIPDRAASIIEDKK